MSTFAAAELGDEIRVSSLLGTLPVAVAERIASPADVDGFDVDGSDAAGDDAD